MEEEVEVKTPPGVSIMDILCFWALSHLFGDAWSLSFLWLVHLCLSCGPLRVPTWPN